MNEKLALYFGSMGDGHFLHGIPGTRISLDGQRDQPGFPWEIGLLDTGLLTNREVPDQPDGRVHWTCGGRTDFWFAFFWWDRSKDSRGNSNSGFYVRWPVGEVNRKTVDNEAPKAFAFACECWPDVVRRQRFQLTLVDPPKEPKP
jgi:hypothetical protein